jgi:hypothetical protein
MGKEFMISEPTIGRLQTASGRVVVGEFTALRHGESRQGRESSGNHRGNEGRRRGNRK